MGESRLRLHLKLPAALLETLQPTGCRKSKEAEAAWRLGAAIDVAREFKLSGRLPVLRLTSKGEGKPKEIQIPLTEEQVAFLNATSEEEGGSRGFLTRELLLVANKALEGKTGCLSHQGLMEEIKKLF